MIILQIIPFLGKPFLQRRRGILLSSRITSQTIQLQPQLLNREAVTLTMNSFVNVHQLKEKIGNKKELYDFLVQECGAYLPKLQCTNVYFLRSILNGEKEHLKRADVIVAAVPQIEGLTVEDFLEYAASKSSIMSFLPDQSDWLHLDKRWICDILMSLDKDGVNQMITDTKRSRRAKLDQTQGLLVPMRPEFAKAFEESLSFSVHKGRSAYLMKPTASRKRRAKEIEEDKQEEQNLRESKQKYLEVNKRMRQDFDQMNNQLQDLSQYKNLVMQLMGTGVIDEDGTQWQMAKTCNSRIL